MFILTEKRMEGELTGWSTADARGKMFEEWAKSSEQPLEKEWPLGPRGG